MAKFKYLETIVVKSSVFCDITQCSPLKVNRRFGETRRLKLHGRIISKKKKTA
jgi:hypothetical protein